MAQTIDTHIQLHQDTPTSQVWDEFVSCHPHGHFLQISRWGSFKSQFGWRSDRVVLHSQQRGHNSSQQSVVSGASILYRRMAGITLAYVPKGPITDWSDVTLTDRLFARIEARCRQQGASVLKIEPYLPDSLINRNLLAKHGFLPSQQTIQPRSTILLDISDTEEAILQRMKSKWRYNIRLAARKGVVVRAGTEVDLPDFYALMQATGQRDGFAVHSRAYFDAAFKHFVPNDAVFLFAEYEKQPIAAIVVFVTGRTAWYVWGASSNRERSRMPNHALQWAAIQWAKTKGAVAYDFWGIPDDVGLLALGCTRGNGDSVPADVLPIDIQRMPMGALWGVYRLKQGFGGDVIRTVGAWDKPLAPLGFRIYQAGLNIRHTLPKVRAQATKVRRQIVQSSVPESSPTVSAIHTQGEWQSVLDALPNPHILQSWEWGAIKAQTGWHADRFALSVHNGKPQAAFQLLWRQPLPAIPIRIGYVPKGPLVDWANDAAVEAVLEQVIEKARAHNCLFVKIDPDVREDSAEGIRLRQRLRQQGWTFSPEQIQFKNTAFSHLMADEEKLLQAMKSKWRYNIRLAERRGVTVREGGPDDFHTFYKLYAQTGQRDGFLVRPFAYYNIVWQTLLQSQANQDSRTGAVLLLAEHAEETMPLAGLFLMRYGERAWYFYGASSDLRRRDMPNYLLQWEGLRWARQQGCILYDWWGAPTESNDPDDEMQGVWRFKQGFGAKFQPHIGAWDWALSPILYHGYRRLMPRVLSILRALP